MSDCSSDNEDESSFTLFLPDDVIDALVEWVEEQVDVEETREYGLTIYDGVLFHWIDTESELSDGLPNVNLGGTLDRDSSPHVDEGECPNFDTPPPNSNSDTSSMYNYDSDDEESGMDSSLFARELWGLGFLTEHRFRDFVHRPPVRLIWERLWNASLASAVPADLELPIDVAFIYDVSRRIQWCWDGKPGPSYTADNPDTQFWTLKDHLARFALSLGPLCDGKGLPLKTCKVSLVWAWAAIELADVLRSMQVGYGPDDGRREVWARPLRPGDARDNKMPHYRQVRKKAIWLAGLELIMKRVLA